jgi:transcriptional regulator with XRE-family HTH domain
MVFCCFWRAVLVSLAAFLRYIFTLPSESWRELIALREAIRRFTVDIGKRLRELRRAKGLSQHDVEDLTGLQGPYVSRVENGHTTPKLPVLEKWARALDIDLHQLFDVGHGQPEAREHPARVPTGERTLLKLFRQMPADDRSLLISLAREMVRRKGIRG